MGNNTHENTELSLTSVITQALKVPGIQVNRTSFLAEHFKNEQPDFISEIIDKGPVEAGLTRDELYKKARKIVWDRTLFSSTASFIAGLPGGWTMAATIPADLLQFYAVALRMAQEIMYLYGEQDLWINGTPDDESVMNQLLLYCGTMFGVSGAASAVRVMSSALAKQVAKKLPQQALTKTFYYPIVKSIAKFFGAKMTKDIFAKGLAKAIPIVGGVISGGITMVSMRPMGLRLVDAFDKSKFAYTEELLQSDIEEVVNFSEEELEEQSKKLDLNTIWKGVSNKAKAASEKAKSGIDQGVALIKKATRKKSISPDVMLAQIQEAKEMLDNGIINEEEFAQIKAQIINRNRG